MKNKQRKLGLVVSWLALAALLVTAVGAVPAAAQPADAGAQSEYLVVLGNSGRIHPRTAAQVERAGGEIANEIPQIGVLVVRADADFPARAKGIAGVAEVGPNVIWELDEPVAVQTVDVGTEGVGDNDLYLALQWDIRRVGGDADTWEIEKGFGATVAVLDTGVYYPHPDIAPNYAYGKSYVVDHWHPDLGDVPGEDENDYHGHGTHVAGSIGAPITQGRIIGVAPEVRIANYKVLAAAGYGYQSWIVEAIVDAADDGVHVINMSLGGYRLIQDSDAAASYVAYLRATQYARQQGALVVASSGNAALDLTKIRPWFHVPSGTPAALSVNATGMEDELAVYSNYGASETRVVAPGGGVTDIPFSLCVSAYSPLGQLEGAMYVWMAGTSMAAPKVAGVAALIYAQNPQFGPAQVEARLMQTADPVNGPGFNNMFGHGIAHAYRALTVSR